MTKNTVLIFGSGHLAYRLKKLVQQNGYTIFHSPKETVDVEHETGSAFENFNEYIKSIDLSDVVMVYLLDDRDEYNLQHIIAFISLNKSIPITASLFNENLIPALDAAYGNLTIMNPAKIAAPAFVEALYQSLDREVRYRPTNSSNLLVRTSEDHMIGWLTGSFAIVVAIAIAFFHFTEGLSWIDAAYFVVVTVATVGYGDINLLASPVVSKVFVILLILASTFFIWMIFSLTIDHLLKKRAQASLGRKKYKLENHIIVCGLGRLGYFIVEELLKRGENVMVIERSEDTRYINYFRTLGAEIYIGDARVPRVLSDVCADKAKALFSVINDDLSNLEIGLNARSFRPDLRLILRIFDKRMAEELHEHLDIHLTLSTSAIVDDKLFGLLKQEP